MLTTQLLKPHGLIHTQNKTYFLMYPDPLPALRWQSSFQSRWSVVPADLGATDFEKINGNTEFVYPPIRSLISHYENMSIEIILDMKPIWVHEVPTDDTEPIEQFLPTDSTEQE